MDLITKKIKLSEFSLEDQQIIKRKQTTKVLENVEKMPDEGEENVIDTRVRSKTPCRDSSLLAESTRFEEKINAIMLDLIDDTIDTYTCPANLSSYQLKILRRIARQHNIHYEEDTCVLNKKKSSASTKVRFKSERVK